MAGKRSNNSHKHVMANHQPRQDAARRKLLADARQAVYNEMTIEQKLKMLPDPPQCEKQRNKLTAALEKRNNNGNAPKTEATKS